MHPCACGRGAGVVSDHMASRKHAITLGFAMGAAAKFGMTFGGSTVAQLFASKAVDKLGNGIQVRFWLGCGVGYGELTGQRHPGGCFQRRQAGQRHPGGMSVWGRSGRRFALPRGWQSVCVERRELKGSGT